jgi:hypothetical protein
MNLERYNVEFPILLSIDPSVNNLGYALYNMGVGEEMYNLNSDAWLYGTVYPHGKYMQHKWRDAYRQLGVRLDGLVPTHFASEWPCFFSGEKGRIAAQLGYTIDLAGIVGYLAGRFGVNADWISLWKPQQWKGSVPKYVTERKFVRLFGLGAKKAISRGISNDAIDAIMIAEYWLSLYNRQKFSWQHKKEVLGV